MMLTAQQSLATTKPENDEENQNLSILMNRFTKLLSRDLKKTEAVQGLQSFLSLTDDELLLEMVSTSAVLKGAMDERQLKKELRRAQAKQEFYTDLQEFGGTIKAKDAAALMQASRQTVNNHIKGGKLIGIKNGNDYSIPFFQFMPTGKKVEHLEELLSLMKDCSAVAQCSFFMAEMHNASTGMSEARISVLKRTPTLEELKYIKRDAALLLEQTAS